MSQPTQLAIALGYTPKIMLTGYWPPTNEMLRHLSDDPTVNPGGWQGENWRNLGFDVHAYFPEFATGNPTDPGTGRFRVHYDDTSADWEEITGELKPIGIITFSRGLMPSTWEIEDRATNRTSWQTLLGSGQPSVNPPDDSVPAGTVRFSTLPMAEIVEAVSALGVPEHVLIDDQGGGEFLSEFISYHGLWYQAEHANSTGEDRCVAAGHIHVGGDLTVEEARFAMEVTLEVTLRHIRRQLSKTLSVVGILGDCLGVHPPLSMKAHAVGAQTGPSVRQRLIAVLDDCD